LKFGAKGLQQGIVVIAIVAMSEPPDATVAIAVKMLHRMA
jgi:hypothetical protein